VFQHKRHLFFDLDHTLWDFEQNASECLVELFDAFNLSASGITFDQFFSAFSVTNQSLWHQLEQQLITHDYLRRVRFKASLAALNVTISEDKSVKINDGFLEMLPYKKGLINGCMEVLETLQGKYSMHILSNGFQEVQLKKIQNSGLASFFDRIITNELAGARKPDPQIFDFALKNSGASVPDSLMIGDNYEADITGALNAGWDVIHFHEEKRESDDSRYVHVDRLQKILEYL
jgi:putative hydrolase of the HAD superfamily